MLQNWTKYDYYYDFLIGQTNAKVEPHGICRITDKHDNSVYEGQFVDGLLTGYGRHIWPYGYYVGNWKDGKRHGQGKDVFESTIYIGAWKDHMRHGQGKIRSNGKVFEGDWVEDKLNGVHW